MERLEMITDSLFFAMRNSIDLLLVAEIKNRMKRMTLPDLRI